MLLQVSNLRTYLRSGGDEVRAVDGIDFTIDKGQTLCLVGESGSGKSITALSIIQLLPGSGATHPSGRVDFEWRKDEGDTEKVELLALDESRRRKIRGARISMIFQEPMTCLNPVFSVGEQISEALQLHHPGMSASEARERAIDALAQVRIPHPDKRVDEFPHRLSGGQRQRVMIAMAMACEPDLLIADEPTTALDVTVQAEILRLMREMQEQRGTAILFITHDFGVVAAMADRVAVMRTGKIVEEGKLRDILSAPEHPYTRQLLAALPENLKRVRSSGIPPDVGKPEPLVKLQNLQIHFPIRKGLLKRVVDQVRAVDGVNLELPAGMITALVGESGCGKTTLGRALLKLIEPTGGKMFFNNQEITPLTPKEFRPLRREIQIIFQDPISSLNPRLTIANTLTEPMMVHHIGHTHEERLDLAKQALLEVQMKEEHLWRYPHEFSGGQRQRIGIARALALSPKFIVCDEVTSSLDVSVQAEILQMLLRLKEERGLTLLFITHDIGVVEFAADITAVMHEGKIVEVGPTEQVCKSPQHPYTQALIAAVPRISSALKKQD